MKIKAMQFAVSALLILFLANTRPAALAQEAYSVRLLFSFPEQEILGLPLNQAQALAVDHEGNVLVADTGNNRILKFNAKGELLIQVGGFGWEREQFDRPLDISAKWGLDVFVADYNNERIERYDKELNYISSLRAEQLAADGLTFTFPGSVDISKHGELFICDTENDRILKLNSFGEPVLAFGDFSSGEGQLQHPVKIEIMPNDQVFVSDRQASEIVGFDYYGTFVVRFGRGVLNSPNGLSWARGNLLLVADSGNDRIAVFDQNYRSIFFWGERGSKLGAFSGPADVAVSDNQIYVLDSGNNRIQVFELAARRNQTGEPIQK